MLLRLPVLDYVPGGDLFERLKEVKVFSESRARLYAAEIASALAFLHSRSIMYRDLKLENVLLDEEGHIKLCDFGLAKQLDGKAKISNASAFCGTKEYMSPEMLVAKGSYGLAVDWWAYGVLLYACLTGKYPFWGRSQEKLSAKILSGEIWYPPVLTSDARDLLAKLLDRNPDTRLSYTGVRNHPFFATIDWVMLDNREYVPEFIPDVERFLTPSDETMPRWATPGAGAATGSAGASAAELTEVVDERAAASDRVLAAGGEGPAETQRQAVVACQSVIPADEAFVAGYITNNINKWNFVQTRVLLLTNKAIYRVKYNFSTAASIDHVARTALSDITEMQRGEIVESRFTSSLGSGPIVVYGIRVVSSAENLESTPKARTFCPFMVASDELRKDRKALVRAQAALTDELLGAIIAARDLYCGEVTPVSEVTLHRETLSAPRVRQAKVSAKEAPRIRTLQVSLTAVNARIGETEKLLAELHVQRAKIAAELDSLGVQTDGGDGGDGEAAEFDHNASSPSTPIAAASRAPSSPVPAGRATASSFASATTATSPLATSPMPFPGPSSPRGGTSSAGVSPKPASFVPL